MACNMSKASSPRTSPTTMRSGRIRRLLITSCALADRTLAFDIGRAGFQADDVFLLELQFGGVFDGDDAFGVRNVSGEHIQQRGFAGAGSAGDQNDSGGL